MEVVTWIWIGIVALTLLILLTIAGAVIYSGLFTSFTVGAGSPPFKSLVMMYKFGKGPFRDTSPVFNEALSINPEKRTIGLYYDDPKEVAPENLRWAVGSIVAEGSDFPDTEAIGQYMDKGFKVFHTPLISNAVKTQFPYTTPFSIFIAIFRVYPALAEYVQMKKLSAYPYIEIYEGDTIHFVAPLARQDDFFVPEAFEEERDEGDETSERETSTEREETPELGQGDTGSNRITRTESTDSKSKHETPERAEPVAKSGDLLNCDLPPTESDSDRRSVSTASFLTAKSEMIVEKAIEEARKQIQSQLNKRTPEGVQDSGISSTSHQSHSPTPTPGGSEEQAAKISPPSQLDSASNVLDSSSNVGSSMDSINSVNSSVMTQSSCTSNSILSGLSFNTEDSMVTTDDGCSTEVSCDLIDVSGDSDVEVRSFEKSSESQAE